MSFYSRRSSYWDQYDYIDQNPICNKRALPENNVNDNECKLKEILNDTWFKALASTIKSNTDSPEYLGPEKYRSENIIPRRHSIFRALDINGNDTLLPSQWRVIIIGDTPSINIGSSASGIPFYDNMTIKHWIHNKNSSIKYMYFNLLQKYGIIDKDLMHYDKMMEYLNNSDHSLIPKPYEWIKYTMAQGVMWMNQCLTNRGNKEKHQHQRYWKPIVRAILFTILSSKKHLKKRDGNKGTLFIVFDKKTKNFVRSIQSQINPKKKTQIKIIKMDYDFTIHFKSYFHEIKFFQKINESLDLMSMDKIKWLNDDVLHGLNKFKDKNVCKQENKNKKKRHNDDSDYDEDDDLDQFQGKKAINNSNTNVVDDVDSDEFSC